MGMCLFDIYETFAHAGFQDVGFGALSFQSQPSTHWLLTTARQETFQLSIDECCPRS
jgi:hypothetical protein